VKQKFQDRSMEALLIFSLSCAWYLLWLAVVEPVPDRDSVHQLLVPFLDSLHAARENSNPFFLRYFYIEAYPMGMAWIASTLSVMGLGELFLNMPWLLNLLPLMAISSVIASLRCSRKSRVLLSVLVLANPLFQVCLHGLSLHGFLSIFLLCGFLCLREALQWQDRNKLFQAVFYLILASSLKHLGLFHYLGLLLAFGIYCSHPGNRKKYSSWFFLMLGGFLLSLAFYPLSGARVYLDVVVTHNPSIAPWHLLGALALLLVVGLAVWIALCTFQLRLHHDLSRVSLNWNGVFRLAAYCSFLMIFLVCYPIQNSPLWWMSCFGLLSIILCVFLVFKVRLEGVETWDILLFGTLIASSAVLYSSLLGQVAANFFAPILYLFAVLAIRFSPDRRNLLLALVLILLSNFFPGVKTLEKYFWHWGHQIYTRAWNGLQANPLGWEKSRIARVRLELQEALKGVDFFPFRNEVPVIMAGMHFHTRQQLLFSHYLHYENARTVELQNSGRDHLKGLQKELKSFGSSFDLANEKDLSNFETALKSLVSRGKITLLILAIDPLTSFPVPSRSTLNLEGEQDWENFAKDFNDCFARVFKKSTLLRNEFAQFDLGRMGFRLYVHNSFLQQSRVNYSERFALRAQLQAQMFSSLDSSDWYGVNLQAEAYRANLYHEQGAKLMNEGKFLQAWTQLKLGLALVGTHAEMEKDIAQLEEILMKELAGKIQGRRNKKLKLKESP